MTKLSNRMKPESLKEYVGQEHILGEKGILTRMLTYNQLMNIIFYGNSGTGKTSIVNVIGNELGKKITYYNATTETKKDLTTKIDKIKGTENNILFIDEIHRMTKNVIDYLLSFTEDGSIILLGATTESPYHSVNNALLSRSKILELKELSKENKRKIVINALTNKEKGYGNLNGEISSETIDILIDTNTDIRGVLDTLELLVTTTKEEEGKIKITPDDVLQLSGKTYYINEEKLHWLKSSLQKSIRGSSVNASLYYLASLLEGDYLDETCRRLTIIASEDIGLANPSLITRVNIVVDSALKIGLPEARLLLSELVIEMSLSPKSNVAHDAIALAIKEVREGKGELLENLKTKAKEYKYPFDYENNLVKQEYLPKGIDGNYLNFNGNNLLENKFKEQYIKLEKYLKGEK